MSAARPRRASAYTHGTSMPLKPMTSDEIRSTYLEFFEARDHLRLPSASLVPAEHDPSALFTVAGMHPLKPYFLGSRDAAAPARHHLPEDVPDGRHRHHRHDLAPSDVLRDARQLLVRRLLQARGHAVRLGAVDRRLRVSGRADLDHRVRRRRRAGARPRSGCDRGLARDRGPARADRRVSRGRRTSGRPARPVPAARARSCTSIAASSSASPTTCRAATTSASSSTGTSCSCSSTRTR